VISQVHKLAVSRLAAAVLALALSGAVRVAAAQESHEGGHRCACPVGAHGEHDCSCPRCRSAQAEPDAPAPSPEALAAMPPCHRALYEKAAAQRRPPAPSPKPDQDCASPLCSLPDGRLAAAPQVETYLLPQPPEVAVATGSEPLPADRPACAASPASPEPPPPRR
jgi:hypothetical protein